MIFNIPKNPESPEETLKLWKISTNSKEKSIDSKQIPEVKNPYAILTGAFPISNGRLCIIELKEIKRCLSPPGLIVGNAGNAGNAGKNRISSVLNIFKTFFMSFQVNLGHLKVKVGYDHFWNVSGVSGVSSVSGD